VQPKVIFERPSEVPPPSVRQASGHS
jgi:hypothetical protein